MEYTVDFDGSLDAVLALALAVLVAHLAAARRVQLAGLELVDRHHSTVPLQLALQSLDRACGAPLDQTARVGVAPVPETDDRPSPRLRSEHQTQGSELLLSANVSTQLQLSERLDPGELE